MLRNWVTQFGYGPGERAGGEQIPEDERSKFVAQIGAYFGWTPPPGYNWVVEVTKDKNDQYVMVFMRYATPAESSRLLGENFKKDKPDIFVGCSSTGCHVPSE